MARNGVLRPEDWQKLCLPLWVHSTNLLKRILLDVTVRPASRLPIAMLDPAQPKGIRALSQ